MHIRCISGAVWIHKDEADEGKYRNLVCPLSCQKVKKMVNKKGFLECQFQCGITCSSGLEGVSCEWL